MPVLSNASIPVDLEVFNDYLESVAQTRETSQLLNLAHYTIERSSLPDLPDVARMTVAGLRAALEVSQNSSFRSDEVQGFPRFLTDLLYAGAFTAWGMAGRDGQFRRVRDAAVALHSANATERELALRAMQTYIGLAILNQPGVNLPLSQEVQEMRHRLADNQLASSNEINEHIQDLQSLLAATR